MAVIVLSYGLPNPSDDLITRLLADGLLRPTQVVEVHNPRTPGEVAPTRVSHNVVNLEHNVGYAGGMNVGIDRLDLATSRFALLLTHDARIDGSTVLTLRETLIARPEVAAVGPVLICDDRVWSAGQTRTRLWAYRHAQRRPSRPQAQIVDSLDGSVLMIELTRLGALRFDDQLFMYFEETDLIERLRREGAGCAAVVPGATAETSPGDASRPCANAYLMARNGLYVASRYGGRRGALAYAVHLLRASLVEAGLVLALHRQHREKPSLTAARIRARHEGIRAFLRHGSGPPPAWILSADAAVEIEHS